MENEDLKALYSKRSSIKGRITKFKNYLEKISDSDSLSSIQVNELILKLNAFKNLLTQFDELQTNIEVLNSSSLKTELIDREIIEDDLHLVIATAQDILEHSAPHKGLQTDSQTPAENNDNHNTPGLRLAPIDLPKFDGTYSKWLGFRDLFQALVHNNKGLLTALKFRYLSQYLEGEAAAVISNLETSDSNYSVAWGLLCDRYDNKRILINTHLNSLFNFESLQRESDKSLRFLIDHVTKNLRALKTLGQPTDKWDTLIIYHMAKKLDHFTSIKWEEFRNSLKELPTLDDFNRFLKGRADVLETVNQARKDKQPRNLTYNSNPQYKHTKSFVISAQPQNNNYAKTCVVCQGNHRIFDCSIFKRKARDDKISLVNDHKLCHNCLRGGHDARRCRLGGCRICKQRHNTILHNDTSNTNITTLTQTHPTNNLESTTSITMAAISSSEVLLSTALVDIINPSSKRTETIRALLDSGSQSSFITESLHDRLQLTSQPLNNLNIKGIGNSSLKLIPKGCNIQLKSKQSNFTVILSCLILPQITDMLPKHFYDLKQFNIPVSFKLADPNFNIPSKVDMLIGADLFWELIGTEHHLLGHNQPILHNSKLGWLLSGPITSNITNKYKQQSNASIFCNFSATERLENSLSKFWELEDLPCNNISTEEDNACEEHFIANTYRHPNGRFCVRLPLKDTTDCLGDSYHVAYKRFLNLERRFRRQPHVKQMYSDFIKEYADLGHLSDSETCRSNAYYLPHHAVLKEKSESTKLRVVFDASARTSSGLSINDLQMVGLNIQDSLFNILIRFRNYKYVISGDIEKQFRQILLNELDRELQLILWRDSENSPLRTLRLNTVTYGFASASFLASRCLYQLGEECSDPQIKDIIQKDFYCDDLLSGADTEEDLLHIQSSVSRVLSSGCLNLRKYRSNSETLLKSKTINSHDALALSHSCDTLGLRWVPKSDSLHFPIDIGAQSAKAVTKRSILSATFKIFDPLGLLSLCTIHPKILIQRLWQAKLSWDDPVPNNIKTSWQRFSTNLHHLHSISIPRNVICSSPVSVEIHSFSDASQLAYAACVYARSVDLAGTPHVRLLCAKARVAPLKSITIPKLELCGALHAARLSSAVSSALRRPISRYTHWTDSTVVLGWLNTDTSKLKTFVANRVANIHEISKGTSWRYVPTKHNPADLASRGVDPQLIPKCLLWWHGPEFLLGPESGWPTLPSSPNDHLEATSEQFLTLNKLPEIKANSVVLTGSLQPSLGVINFEKYSKLKFLQRVVAYMLRFAYNAKHSQTKLRGPLSANELNNSLCRLMVLAQRESFPKDLYILQQNKQLKPKSNIASLTPYIDTQGLLRVGGRLEASNYDYNKKHPILLSAKHSLTKLIFIQEHITLMHAGPQLLLANIRERVWPLGGRELARRTARNCNVCRRMSGRTTKNIMGNLPPQRLSPDFPFSTVALDFAGPFMIADRRGRGCKITKCYLCLFICFRYKCVHLEAVSELSKDAFILALRRFISRRGKVKEIFCDNGRNFVAASKEVNDFLRYNTDPLINFAADQSIKFTFSPAYAPNFNGYAEAGIKSAKFHIKRIMGNTHLTFEELTTLFSQVEAILNSRPLYPLSSSPNDFSPLTPGHFIIGRPLTSLPSPSLEDTNTSRLDRFQRIEQARQHFWKRWAMEYLAELQERTKWRTRCKDLREGDLVILKEDGVPPLSWRLGRVTKLYPGADGVPRVADIATSRGSTRRALNRICLLPSPDDDQ